MVDCRSPEKDGGDLWGTVGICRDPAGICGDLSGPAGICGDLWGSVGICLASHSETF